MRNLQELTQTELEMTQGGSWWDQIIGPLEDWLICNYRTGANCPGNGHGN